MKKHKLVIASVLKPVDDTRMYEKFALSLDQTNKYDINIIGFYVKKLPHAKNITFHRLFRFERLDPSRLFAPWLSLKRYIKLKPELIIINTHELLLVTQLYKIIFGCKVIYDVRENYYRNVLYTDSFPKLIKPILATYIRIKEYTSRLLVDHYFLAEKHYEKEFSFTKGKSTVIQNKYKLLPAVDLPLAPPSGPEIRLVFTGTLAESTGVFEAIAIATKLHAADPSIRLDIIGRCAKKSTYQRLMRTIENKDFIHLKGGLELVSHEDILYAIKEADFGIIFYPANRSTLNTMPTKLFEYLGNRLSILLQHHEPWVAFCAKYNAAVTISPEDLNAAETLRKMKAKSPNKSPDDEILWQAEEKILLDRVAKIITTNT